MLFVHEVHRVAGRDADDFEAAWRDGLMPTLGGSSDARLLWFLHQAHGTGPAYTIVTVTAVASAAAWEALGARMRTGDLASWAAGMDRLRHRSDAKVLELAPFSGFSVDLASVPVDGREHENTLFMEDTAWPDRGRMADYLEKAGTLYVDTLDRPGSMPRAGGRVPTGVRDGPGP